MIHVRKAANQPIKTYSLSRSLLTIDETTQICMAGSFLENLPRGGKIEIFGYEGGRGSIHGNMGLHAF